MHTSLGLLPLSETTPSQPATHYSPNCVGLVVKLIKLNTSKVGDDRDNYENTNEIIQTIDFSAELKAEKMVDVRVE